MNKDKFIQATEINKKIEQYTEHKVRLEKSNIQYGGELIFRYNSHINDVELKEEVYGKDFFKNYMEALDNKIETLQKEFNEL